MGMPLSFVLTLLVSLPQGGVAPPSWVIQLPLGQGTGIRGLASLPDGRLLVLSGPAQDQSDVPQGLSLVAPNDQPVWEAQPLLPRIEAANADAKAEGLAVLAAADGTLRVLVLFEDPAQDPSLDSRIRALANSLIVVEPCFSPPLMRRGGWPRN
jgi:hypothetical protein